MYVPGATTANTNSQKCSCQWFQGEGKNKMDVIKIKRHDKGKS